LFILAYRERNGCTMLILPTGTVTFLFTDIEGSTRLWEEQPNEARAALLRHDQLLEQIVVEHGGNVVRPRGEGDSRFAVFARATEAVVAACAIQHALYVEPWCTSSPVKVRVALHTGEADQREGDYYGSAVNRCARIRGAAHGGQTLLSQATWNLVHAALPSRISLRDLGEHRLKDLQGYEHIFQAVTPDVPSDFPPLRVLDNRPNNLPIQRSELLGREKELEALQALLLRQGSGLLTLTGPGGTGKTRLALQVGANLIDDFPDGVFLVNLTPVSNPSLVLSEIARTLGVRGSEGQPLTETLKEYIRGKQLLLLLDNFEQVVEAASLVAALLATAPRLKVLVTSRAVLHLRGEQEFRVPPLRLPDARRLPPLGQISQYGAVALFVERAKLVKPEFELTAENASVVVEICRRLDGLPLPIELAAARIRLFPPQAMLARLESRLKLLTGGARDLPAHQQTMRSAVAWSYDLLHPEEQKLFRRMSVFVGSCTLEAAEAVCSPYQGSALEIDVVDGVSSLLEKSLLQQEELHGEPRFRMLETIQEFGLEMLAESGDKPEIRRQHAAFYLELGERAESALRGGELPTWLERLQAEHGNMRATLAWALDPEKGDPQIALRLCWNLLAFWIVLGYANEGLVWVERATQAPGAPNKPSYGEALVSAGILAISQVDLTAARSWFEQAVPVLRDSGNRLALGSALTSLSVVLTWQEGPETAQSMFEEGITLLREEGDEYYMAQALTSAGLVAMFSDLGQARLLLEEALPLMTKLGSPAKGRVLVSLGDLARMEGDYTRARALYEESLVLLDLPRNRELPALLHNLGHVALGLGETEKARKLFDESLSRHLDLENKVGAAEALAGLAAVAGACGQFMWATRLFGAVEAMSESSGSPMWPAERVEWERNVAHTRAQLDEITWHKTWQEGRAMSMEAAIQYAEQLPVPDDM
jgi:predicted ATPase/class 3 adenylate cyclase